MVEELPHYQYDSKTIELDGYLIDAEALNAYIRRAESAYNKSNVKYCIGQNCPNAGKGVVNLEPESGAELVLDCSGYAYWSTYRKGVYAHAPNKYWVQVSKPIPGATVRYSAKAGNKYGHSGVIIAPAANGNFQTLDSTSGGPPKSSAGSIYYRPDGYTKWIKKGGPNPMFLVSSEAIISKDGAPFKHDTNLLLAAAKRPVTVAVGAVLVLGLLGYVAYGFVKQKEA